MANELITPIGVTEVDKLTAQGETTSKTLEKMDMASLDYVAVWDTGATGTVISQKVVDNLGLKPSGKANIEVVGPAGQAQPNRYVANTYLVDLILPNSTLISSIRVSDGDPGGGDVLIGMDVIQLGDLSVSNFKGRTVISFRLPSVEEIDFVKEIGEFKQKYGGWVAPGTINRKERNKRKRDRRQGKRS